MAELSTTVFPFYQTQIEKAREAKIKLGFRQKRLSNSVYEHFVRQPFPRNSPNQRLQPVNRVDFAVALVETEGEFIYVERQMFFAKPMESAVESSLQNSPKTLDPVRVSHSVHILLCRVIDHFVGIVAIKPST